LIFNLKDFGINLIEAYFGTPIYPLHKPIFTITLIKVFEQVRPCP